MVLVWFVAGSIVEVLNALMRWWSVGRLSPDARGLSMAIFTGGFVLRLGLTGLVLLMAFRHSVLSGVAALVGFWICRWVMIWRVTRHVG